MSGPYKHQILRLYKELLRYGQQLEFTDKAYYTKRIKKEFKKNQNLENIEDITYHYNKGLKLLEKKLIA